MFYVGTLTYICIALDIIAGVLQYFFPSSYLEQSDKESIWTRLWKKNVFQETDFIYL